MVTHRLNKTRTTTWEINANGDTWIVGEKGRITDAAGVGIRALNTIDTTTIRIDGRIETAGVNSEGISLDSTGLNKITISESGFVSGYAAINHNNMAGRLNILNDGAIKGEYWGILANTTADGATIRNDGRIMAGNTGIDLDGAGASIVNNGRITAGSTGIVLSAAVNDNPTSIINNGKITASDYAIDVGSGAVNIRNKGVINGDVGLVGGNDVFNNRGGTVNGNIYGGFGDDVFNMVGGKLNGILYGGAGNDTVTLSSNATVYIELLNEGTDDTVRINGTYQLGANIENLVLLGKGNHVGIGNDRDNDLTGNKGANALYGFGGNDVISGGRGNDTLTGGNGDDAFVFKAGYGRDTVMDFVENFDVIDLSSYGFANFAAVENLMIDVGDNLVIAFSDTDRLTIRGYNKGDLDMGSFDLM